MKKSIEHMNSEEWNLSIYNNLTDTDRFYICGIDPGQNTGLSFIEIDRYFNVTNLFTLTLHLPTDVYLISKNISRTNYLYSLVRENLDYFKPLAVGVELPFQHRFANAVIQLSQYLATIETAIYHHSPYILNYRYPPKLVKKEIGATGNADKDGMTKAVKAKPELKKYIKNYMSEHEIDATAIAYITYSDIKLYPHKLLLNRENFNFYRGL